MPGEGVQVCGVSVRRVGLRACGVSLGCRTVHICRELCGAWENLQGVPEPWAARTVRMRLHAHLPIAVYLGVHVYLCRWLSA